MTQQVINVGAAPNDGDGDPLRTAFTICNENFTELYNIGGITGIANGNSNISIVEDSTVSISSTGVANVLVVSQTGATILGTTAANIITATGNITSTGVFIGNGAGLTGITSSPAAGLITGTTLSSNVVTSSLTTVGTLGNLAVTGNITSGNLQTSGAISTSGNVVASNFNTGGALNATGNVTGGNLITAGQISAGGDITAAANITATNFIGDRKSVV